MAIWTDLAMASGLAHGKEWALAPTKLEPSVGPPVAPKVRHGTFSASEPVAIALTGVTVNAVRIAVAEVEAYRSPARPSTRRPQGRSWKSGARAY